MVAAKLATMKQGARIDLSPIGEMSQAKAAELLNVGKRSVERAADVRETGAPELVRAVERGTVSVAAAADVATMSLEAQRELLAQCDRRALLEAAKQVRGARAEARRAERIARIIAISSGNSALPSDRKYSVILADPPWHFEVYNEDSGVERAAANHYPTMSLSEICELPIADLATPDAVVFLWTTAPHLHAGVRGARRLGIRIRQQCRLAQRQDRAGLLGPESTRVAVDRAARRHADASASPPTAFGNSSARPRAQPQA